MNDIQSIPTREDFIKSGWELWPVWLCGLITLHAKIQKWGSAAYDGSCSDMFADGKFCMCGTHIRRLR